MGTELPGNPGSNSDEGLIREVADGSLMAFDLLVRKYQDFTWRLAQSFVHNHEEAADIVQEAFIKVLRSAQTFRGSSSFKTWFFRIVVNLCIDTLRKRKRLVHSVPDDLVDGGKPASDKLDEQRRDTLIREVIQRLPFNQRAAVILRYYSDCSYHEIGLVIGKTRKAVERLLSRARETLRISIKEIPGVFER